MKADSQMRGSLGDSSIAARFDTKAGPVSNPHAHKDTIDHNGKPKLCSAQLHCWGNPFTALDFFFLLFFFFLLKHVVQCLIMWNTLSFNMSDFFYPLSLPLRLSLDNHTHCGQCQKKPTLCLCPAPYLVLTTCQDIDRVQDLSQQPCQVGSFCRIPFQNASPVKLHDLLYQQLHLALPHALYSDKRIYCGI